MEFECSTQLGAISVSVNYLCVNGCCSEIKGCS